MDDREEQIQKVYEKLKEAQKLSCEAIILASSLDMDTSYMGMVPQDIASAITYTQRVNKGGY